MDHSAPLTNIATGRICEELTIRDNETTDRASSRTANIPLREWIVHAIKSISSAEKSLSASDPPSKAACVPAERKSFYDEGILSSDEFLLPALRVARSLAKQCCKEEHIPLPGSNWASQTFVKVSMVVQGKDEPPSSCLISPSPDPGVLDLEPLPFSTSHPDDGSEFSIHNDDLPSCFNNSIHDENLNLDIESLSFSSLKPQHDIDIVFNHIGTPSCCNNHSHDDEQISDLEPLPFSTKCLRDDLSNYSNRDDNTFRSDNPFRENVSLEPLPFTAHNPHDDVNHNLNNDVIEFLSGTSPIIDDLEEVCSYLDVIDAGIAPTLKDFNYLSGRGGNEEKNELESIYSLGLVLYELFFGGSVPQGLQDREGFSTHRHNNFKSLLCVDEMYGVDGHSGRGSSNVSEGKNDEPNGMKSVRGRKKNQHQEPSDSNRWLDLIENLRLKGLPSPLCDLIANMIDCGNADFRGDESYCRMSDVVDDLTLMLRDPGIFLRGIDVTKLSAMWLQFDKISFFGREKEMNTLRDAYYRSISGRSEVALMSGQSGTGKTLLATHFSKFVKASGGVFLSAKFDQLKQTQSCLAVGEAFNKYFDLLEKEGSSYLKVIVNKLVGEFGRDIYDLMKIMPSLKKNIGDDLEGIGKAPTYQDSANQQSRLQFILFKFVEVISSSSEVPITLFLDDLQWADEASIGVIRRIMLLSQTATQMKHFFFLGSCREDEMDGEHAVRKMILDLRLMDVTATVIPVPGFDGNTLNTIISQLLCLPPRLTQTLSTVVYQKTKGNPLFFSRLIESLNKDGFLRLSLQRRRWVWHLDSIKSTALPDDVAIFFTKTISILPREVQQSLCVLSCFGAFADIAALQTLENELKLDIVGPLDIAVKECLVARIDDKYSFVHDRVQSVVYQMIDAEKRPAYHFHYGLCLSTEAMRTRNDAMLFIAVVQINRGGPSTVSSKEQGIAMAKLNLHVGIKCTNMCNYTSAFEFFKAGLLFLPSNSNGWIDDYDLSLQLYENAAKCSLDIGNFSSLSNYVEQVSANAKSFEDKLNTLFISTCALMHTFKYKEAVGRSLHILSHLGENLPESKTEVDLLSNLSTTQEMLSKLTDVDLLNYKQMMDSSKLMVMKFLAKLQIALLVTKPDDHPFVTLSLVQMTIDHGVSPVSCVGFVYFGALLAHQGMVSEGYRFAKLGKELLHQRGSWEVAGEVNVVSAQVLMAVEPMQSANDYFLDGYRASMNAGDANQSLLNIRYYTSFEFWMGTKLSTTKEKMARSHKLVEQHGERTWLKKTVTLEKIVDLLLMDDEPSKINVAISESLQDICVVGLTPHQRMVAYFQKMYISFMFRRLDEMILFTEKFLQSKLYWRGLAPIHAFHSFFSGVVSFLLYRHLNESTWMERGNRALESLRFWQSFSNWNFSHKVYLLEAEKHFCNRNLNDATVMYEKSIAFAHNHKFYHEEALACEMAGYFFEDIGEINASVSHLSKSIALYQEWGASAKAKHLRDHFGQLFGLAAKDIESSKVMNKSILLTKNANHSIGLENTRKRVLI